jgi:outer membrane protein OmpA-like peptidoglycan-associated protein
MKFDLPLFVLAATVASTSALMAADAPGAKDHGLLKRITGSEIIWYKFAKYDEMPVALEKVEWSYQEDAFKKTKKEKPEGALTTIYYKLPGDASTLEAVRQYQELLEPAGYVTLFTAANDELDNGYNRFVSQIFPDAPKTPELQYLHEFNHDEQRYAVLKGTNANGATVYVSIYAFLVKDDSGFNKLKEAHDISKGNCIVRVDVLETKPMEARMTVVKAEEIEQSIAKTGRIAIYGIYFDTDKAEIKPESAASLAEMAKAINEAPSGKFLIVGHTDNQGGLAHNQELSVKRANAVTKALTSDYKVPGGSVIPVGVGMAAPVAPNTDENGRAKNRRVEIVAM